MRWRALGVLGLTVVLAACLGILIGGAVSFARTQRGPLHAGEETQDVEGEEVDDVEGNKSYAEATAKRLLEVTPLPEGARAVARNESADPHVLDGPEARPVTTQLVQAHAFWRVPGTPQATIEWIEHHAPQRSTLIESGNSGRRGVTTSRGVIFSFAKVPGRLSTVWLSVSVAEAKGGGTALRANALIAWISPRPSLEHIPAGVHEITLKVTNRRRHIAFTQQITNASKITDVTAVVEALERPSAGEVCAGGAVSAGPPQEPIVELAFRDASGARPVARVKIDENGGCGGTVTFSVHGHKQPTLSGAIEAVHELHRLVGRTL